MLFELIQIAFGYRQQLSRQLSLEEWREVYEQADKQAVVGIVFDGVQTLPKEQWPPQSVLFEWVGQTEQIRQQNAYADKQTAKIWNRLKEDGLDTAILKGQGIATLYNVGCLKADGRRMMEDG